MFKYLLIIIFSLFSTISIADDELPPLDPAYEGVHGMVIVNKGSNLYVSNMAGYAAPHNAQVLYKIEMRELSLIQLVRDADLVTIKTKPFNLQRLIRGEKITIPVEVYLGHFARGGMRIHDSLDITFSKQLYVRMLEELETKDRTQKYDVVEVGTDERILIHQIQTPPSYDQLLLITEYANCITQFKTSVPVPEESELIRKLMYCGPMKPLYFEAEAFKN